MNSRIPLLFLCFIPSFIFRSRPVFADDLEPSADMERALKTMGQSMNKEKARQKTAASVPVVGHGNPVPDRYDIWQQNCHTAANRFVCAAPDKSKAGIIACGGHPEQSPAHHTVNWMILADGQTCVYNWGTACCWEGSVSPPDVTSVRGTACLMKACGKQYGDETRILAAGELVERPNFLVCTLIAAGTKADRAIRLPEHANFSRTHRPQCMECCEQRADMWKWSPELGGKGQFKIDRDIFHKKCTDSCVRNFDLD